MPRERLSTIPVPHLGGSSTYGNPCINVSHTSSVAALSVRRWSDELSPAENALSVPWPTVSAELAGKELVTTAQALSPAEPNVRKWSDELIPTDTDVMIFWPKLSPPDPAGMLPKITCHTASPAVANVRRWSEELSPPEIPVRIQFPKLSAPVRPVLRLVRIPVPQVVASLTLSPMLVWMLLQILPAFVLRVVNASGNTKPVAKLFIMPLPMDSAPPINVLSPRKIWLLTVSRSVSSPTKLRSPCPIPNKISVPMTIPRRNNSPRMLRTAEPIASANLKNIGPSSGMTLVPIHSVKILIQRAIILLSEFSLSLPFLVMPWTKSVNDSIASGIALAIHSTIMICQLINNAPHVGSLSPIQ